MKISTDHLLMIIHNEVLKATRNAKHADEIRRRADTWLRCEGSTEQVDEAMIKTLLEYVVDRDIETVVLERIRYGWF